MQRTSIDEEGQNTWLLTVLIDALKTETSNLVLNPSLHWKPMEWSEQCCCTCMPGLTKDKSGCMILYAEVYSVCCQGYQREENYSSRTYRKVRKSAISGQEGANISNSAQLTEQNTAQVFNMCIHGECFIWAETKVSNILREWYVTTGDGLRGKVRDDLTKFWPGANGHKLRFIIIHPQPGVTQNLAALHIAEQMGWIHDQQTQTGYGNLNWR